MPHPDPPQVYGLNLELTELEVATLRTVSREIFREASARLTENAWLYELGGGPPKRTLTAERKRLLKVLDTHERGFFRSLCPCYDCGQVDPGYMVTDEVWKLIWPDYRAFKRRWSKELGVRVDGNLCLQCVERRLGRPLTIEDFPDRPPINWWIIRAHRVGHFRDIIERNGP